MPHDEHRDLSLVLTLIPDLGRNEIIRRKTLDLSGPQGSPLFLFLQQVVETILVKERRVGEAREGSKKPRLVPFAPDGGLSDEIRSEPSDAFTVLEIVDVDLIFDLLQSISLSSPVQTERDQPTSFLYTMTRWSPTNTPISSFASFCSGTKSFCVNFLSAISIVMIFSCGASLFVKM